MTSDAPHPIPWSVDYDDKMDSWDAGSSPRVVDANGNVVVVPPQNVDHPGRYDATADGVCKLICNAVNFVHSD